LDLIDILSKKEEEEEERNKSSNGKFHQNLSSGSRNFPSGRPDKRDEANSHFSQFC
jgi:hypothetical protein